MKKKKKPITIQDCCTTTAWLPKMDAVDRYQEDQLNLLKMMDSKHDAQFLGLWIVTAILLLWTFALTLYFMSLMEKIIK